MALKVEPPLLSGYEFVRHLGSGGYSEVFVYKDLQLGREVAVKVLVQGASEDEARVMAQLASHTHIVDVYSVGSTPDGLAYLVMQLYSGPTFAQRLRSGTLSVAEVVQLGVQLSGAVEWAHQLGVLHRDIKPANVLTSGTGRPGLADFGISTSAGDRSEQSGVSLPWVPPEVLEGNAADELGDVYSLAATLFTLLEGHPPFVHVGGENTDQAVVRRTLTAAPPILSRTDIPPSLSALLRSALSKDPAARPPSAEALGRALQGVEADMRLAQTPLEVGSTVAAPVDRTDEDATRVRGVHVIESQPLSEMTRARREASSSAFEESTRARSSGDSSMISVPSNGAPVPAGGRRRTVSTPELPAQIESDDGAGAEIDDPKRGPTVLIGGVIVAVVAAVIVVALVGGKGQWPPPSTTTSSSTPPSWTTPPPRDLQVERVDSDSVRVSWTAPEEGLKYSWRRCDGDDNSRTTTTSETSVVISGVSDGASVCVAVKAGTGIDASDEEIIRWPSVDGDGGS